MTNPDNAAAEGAPLITVPSSEIRRDASSYVDPQGFVFHWRDGVYRYIYPDAAERFNGLLDSGKLEVLKDRYGLVQTERALLKLEGLANGVVLRHERINPLTYCVEWSPSMLRDAGRTTLELASALIDDGLCLQDAYPWNVLFDGPDPVFVDVTSIAPLDAIAVWPAQEQFEAFFLRPLILSAQGKGRAARALMLDNISGVGLAEFSRMVSTGYRLSHPGLAAILWLDNKLQKSTKSKERVRVLSERAAAKANPATRKRFMRRLEEKIGALRFKSEGDPWARYYAEIDSKFDRQAKLDAICRILDREKPENVLDLGCNTGVLDAFCDRKSGRVEDYTADCKSTLSDPCFGIYGAPISRAMAARAFGSRYVPWVDASFACNRQADDGANS
jgi:hypothetical protein